MALQRLPQSVTDELQRVHDELRPCGAPSWRAAHRAELARFEYLDARGRLSIDHELVGLDLKVAYPITLRLVVFATQAETADVQWCCHTVATTA